MRVTEEEEDAGLDISEHGMYGYPEQFIPESELVAYGAKSASVSPGGTPRPASVTAMSALPAEGYLMKMVTAYIRHEAFEPIRQDLLEAGYPSLSILEAKGSG